MNKPKPNRLVAALIFVGFALANSPASAGTLTTLTGTNGVSGHVVEDNSASSWGATQWHVKNAGTTTTRKGYIRFDVGTVVAPVTAASLQLVVSTIDPTIADVDQTINIYGLTDQTLDAWNPASTTWNNAPGNDTTSKFAANLTKATLLGTIVLDFNGNKAAPVGTVVSLSNAALVNFLNANTNSQVTFILGRTLNASSGANLLFAGDAHATLAPPTLVFTDSNPTNFPPSFTSNPVLEINATENTAYSATLADNATDPNANATLTFAKVAGPTWLSVAANGALSGTPGSGDVGGNNFTVSVSDGIAPPVTATLLITCASALPAADFYLHTAIPTNPDPGPSDKSWWWDDPVAGSQMTGSFTDKVFDLNGRGMATVNGGSDSFGGILLKKANETITLFSDTYNLSGLVVGAGATNGDNGFVMRKSDMNVSIALMELNGLLAIRASSTERNMVLNIPDLTGIGELRFGRDSGESTHVWKLDIGNTAFAGTINLVRGNLVLSDSLNLFNATLVMNATTGATTMVLDRPAILKAMTFGTTSLPAGTYTAAALNTFFGVTSRFTGAATISIVPPVHRIRAETAANGSGVLVPAQTLQAGNTITAYAIARDPAGAFIANVPAGWAVADVTGFLAAQDFTPAADGRSAVFTAGGSGTGKILAQGNAAVLEPSGTITVNSAPIFSTTRPFILVKANERQGVVDKIANNAWATSLYNQLITRVADNLAAYEANRDGYLRALPVNWVSIPTTFNTSNIQYPLQGKLDVAQDCAVIYYLTGNPRYARLAADVLQNVAAALYNDIGTAGNDGFAYSASSQGSLFNEAREVGHQLPIIYDFMHGYVQANQVWDVATASLTTFSTTNAQSVFLTYWTIVDNYNAGESNWSSLMRNCFLHNALALDNAQTRTIKLNSVVDVDNKQMSLASDHANFDGPSPYSLWPESTQYASSVANGDTNHMSVIEQSDPTRTVYSRFSRILESAQRKSHFNYPNGTQQICYGDGYHDGQGVSTNSSEYIYHFAKRLGRTDLMTYHGGVIANALASGYNRGQLSPDRAGLLDILWTEPVITEAPVAQPVFRTDTLPFAGIALQRNLSSSGGTYGLMSFVGGASYTHSHATGMFMELYGMGQALGVKATGKEDYPRAYAANNTVVVNGYSQGNGGWGDNGMNTVQVVAMEPAARQNAVSSNISFTSSSFVDDVGTGTEATEQRTMAIIRTSPTTGYYVDIFRSESSLANEYHDYIYHNIGNSLTLTDTSGTPLSLTTQATRFTNYTYTTANHGAREAPGWGSWTSVMASSTFTNDVRARFAATPTGSPTIYMDLHIPGDAGREYATARAPNGEGDLPAPYNGTTLVPTLDIRKYGSAWNNPFAVVYEPHGGAANSGSVTNVTTLTQNGVVVGLKVQSVVSGGNVTQYVFSNPNAADSYTDPVAGLYFKGRFGVATLRADGTGELYLGSGSRLACNGWMVTSTSGSNTQASVLLNASGPTSITANTPVVVSASVTVPNVIGLDPGAATTNLVAAGLTVGSQTLQYSDTVPVGKLCQQDPVGGGQAVLNSAVNIGVSAGPSPLQVVNTANVAVVDNGSASTLETTPYIKSFSAGANANKLVVLVSGEGLPSTFSITYRGVALTKIAGSGSGRLLGVFYLDQPYTGGAANLVFDCRRSDAAVNGLGAGIVSFTAASPGGPGAVAVAADKSVNITTTRGGSWVVAGFGGNNVNAVTVGSPLTSLYSAADIGSACGAAGYEANTTSGDHTYSFTTSAVENLGTCAVEILARQPVLVSDVTNQSTTVNISIPPIAFSINSGSGPASLTVTAISSNTAVLPPGGIVLGGSGISRTLTLTPAANQAGTSTVTLSVTDGITTATDTFLLSVTTTPADDWRMAQFGTYANTGNSADTADPEGDGWTNAQEYIFGTNPKTSDNTSPVTIAATGGNLTITFVSRQATGTGYSGRTRYYTVETNNDLTNSAAWTPLAGYTDIPASGQNIQVIIPIATAPRFYRLKVRLQ